jgi:hypothetical protein
MLDCLHGSELMQTFNPVSCELLPLKASACIVVDVIPATSIEVIATTINKKDMFFM